MRHLIAFALGALAAGAVAWAAAIAAAIALQRPGGDDVGLRAGPVTFLAVDNEQRSSTATFGPGLLLVALAGGALNAAAAARLRRRD